VPVPLQAPLGSQERETRLFRKLPSVGVVVGHPRYRTVPSSAGISLNALRLGQSPQLEERWLETGAYMLHRSPLKQFSPQRTLVSLLVKWDVSTLYGATRLNCCLLYPYLPWFIL